MFSLADNRTSLAVYLDRRMWRILLLGFISGFPWVLIGSALSLWLKEDGLSRSAIGWAGLIFSVYAVNFLWAPLIDRVRIPWLSARIGHRKAWIMSLQFIILLCLVYWSVLEPSTSLALVIGGGLVIALCSASQDVTVDALRIEQFAADDASRMAAGAAIGVVGWWSGYKIGGMIALFSADALQRAGYTHYWQLSFLLLAGVIVLCNVGLMLIPEASSASREAAQRDLQSRLESRLESRLGGHSLPTRLLAWLSTTVVGPLQSFFRTNGVSLALALLAFIFLFKIGEAFMGRMSVVFYEEIGFSKSDIAVYSKGLGWFTTVLFTLLGGWITVSAGIVKALFVSGIAMACTNLMFSLLAWSGKSAALFALAVVLDDIAAAFATVAFVTFISLLVDRTYTATQYALLASVGTAGRTLLAASSGALVDGLGGDWGLFFVLTTLMVTPSLFVLWAIRRRLPIDQANDAVDSLSQRASGPVR